MKIDHIGIVVKSLEESIIHWQKVFGYKQNTKIVINTRQKVRVVFLNKENSLSVKLLEPVGPDSPVYRFARKGGGLHHLCFRCAHLETEINKMETMGLKILTPPQPGEAFDGESIAFIYAKHGLNIELIDTDKRIKLISA